MLCLLPLAHRRHCNTCVLLQTVTKISPDSDVKSFTIMYLLLAAHRCLGAGGDAGWAPPSWFRWLCFGLAGSYPCSVGLNRCWFEQVQGAWPGGVVESVRIFFVGFSRSHNSFRFTAHIWLPSRPGGFHPWCRLRKVGSGNLIKADRVVKENQSSPALDQVDENHSPWFSINWNKA